jgi:hypothetical protein
MLCPPIHFMSNISSSLFQGIFKWSLSLMLPNKIHIFFCCTCSTFPIHLNLVDLIILTISHSECYKPWNFSIPFFSPASSYHFLPLRPKYQQHPILKHHYSVQNVRLFVNCIATVLIQPWFGKFSMPWWYMINAYASMIYCVHTKLDQWVSSHKDSLSKLVLKKIYEEHLSHTRNKWHSYIYI